MEGEAGMVEKDAEESGDDDERVGVGEGGVAEQDAEESGNDGDEKALVLDRRADVSAATLRRRAAWERMLLVRLATVVWTAAAAPDLGFCENKL
jgi:hypothetical protein